jgi:hypothetical protein
MNCRTFRSLVKPALLILSGAVLLLSMTQATNAKPKLNFPSNAGTNGSGAGYLSAKEDKLSPTAVTSRKTKSGSRRAVRLPAGCSCNAAPDEWGGFGGCFRSCLQGWGVSYGSLITCGGVCGLAATGNPVGIAVCAACLGTGEWIIAGCALNCIGGGGRWGFLEEVKSRHRTHTHALQQAKLTVKRVTSG